MSFSCTSFQEPLHEPSNPTTRLAGDVHADRAYTRGHCKARPDGLSSDLRILPDYWSSAHHEFAEGRSVATREQCLAEVWLSTPEAYPHTLWTGRVLDVAEGARVIGQAEIIEVVNPLLVTDSSAS